MSRGTETTRPVPDGARAAAAADPARDPAAGRKGRKRVLVVDDEKDLVDLISYNLQRNGYDAETAGNVSQRCPIASRDDPS